MYARDARWQGDSTMDQAGISRDKNTLKTAGQTDVSDLVSERKDGFERAR